MKNALEPPVDLGLILLPCLERAQKSGFLRATICSLNYFLVLDFRSEFKSARVPGYPFHIPLIEKWKPFHIPT